MADATSALVQPGCSQPRVHKICKSHAVSMTCQPAFACKRVQPCAGMQVKLALRTYRNSREGPLALIDAVVEVLRLPGRHHLLPGFAQLLSKQQRTWFRQCIS